MIGTLKFRLLLTVVAVSVICGTTAWADPPSQIGRLSYISGSVSFHPGSLDEWTPATLNYPLTAGDHLWTDTGSRAEVHVLTAAIRLNSNTEFSFLNLDDQTVQVRVPEGSIIINLRSVDAGTTFEIDTPDATVTLPSAGVYRIDVQPSGETVVTVRAGTAELTAGADAYELSAGQTVDISGSDPITSSVRVASSTDEWDAWSAGRDRREDWVAANPYVFHEMIGAEDLNGNGTWLADQSYGPAWTPSNVPAGWAPYRFGHWSWVGLWGWTWIDDSAWGFAPFHYGRWGYQNSRWVWYPGAGMARPVYAPALVVFVGGSGWTPAAGEGIGWFPLGPREAYYPSYQASTGYVQRINAGHTANINIAAYNPNQTVYVNRSVPQGVTFVPRDVFLQSRPAGGAVLSISAAEMTRAPLLGMNAKIAPQRESIVAQPTSARAVPQPPPAMMSSRVYSRIAPAPTQVPFAQQQKTLAASPGRPIDPVTLSGIQRTQKIALPPVTIVKPATLTKLKNPPGLKSSPQTVAAGSAPVGQQNSAKPVAAVQKPTTKPILAKAEQKPSVTPVPVVQKPMTASKPILVKTEQKPAVTPVPVVQKPVTASKPILAKAEQKPAVTPVPVVQKPVTKSKPILVKAEQKPAAKVVPVVQKPMTASKPILVKAEQKPAVTPVPVIRKKPVTEPVPIVQ
jgi:hypothetical protein